MPTTCEGAVPVDTHTPLPLPADRTIPLKFVVPSVSELPDATQTTAPEARAESVKLEAVIVNRPDEEVSNRPVGAVVMTDVSETPPSVAAPDPFTSTIGIPLNVIAVPTVKASRVSVPPLTTANENPSEAPAGSDANEQLNTPSVSAPHRKREEWFSPTDPPAVREKLEKDEVALVTTTAAFVPPTSPIVKLVAGAEPQTLWLTVERVSSSSSVNESTISTVFTPLCRGSP
jgi:hypothetical protein